MSGNSLSNCRTAGSEGLASRYWSHIAGKRVRRGGTALNGVVDGK